LGVLDKLGLEKKVWRWSKVGAADVSHLN